MTPLQQSIVLNTPQGVYLLDFNHFTHFTLDPIVLGPCSSVLALSEHKVGLLMKSGVVLVVQFDEFRGLGPNQWTCGASSEFQAYTKQGDSWTASSTKPPRFNIHVSAFQDLVGLGCVEIHTGDEEKIIAKDVHQQLHTCLLGQPSEAASTLPQDVFTQRYEWEELDDLRMCVNGKEYSSIHNQVLNLDASSCLQGTARPPRVVEVDLDMAGVNTLARLRVDVYLQEEPKDGDGMVQEELDDIEEERTWHMRVESFLEGQPTVVLWDDQVDDLMSREISLQGVHSGRLLVTVSSSSPCQALALCVWGKPGARDMQRAWRICESASFTSSLFEELQDADNSYAYNLMLKRLMDQSALCGVYHLDSLKGEALKNTLLGVVSTQLRSLRGCAEFSQVLILNASHSPLIKTTLFNLLVDLLEDNLWLDQLVLVGLQELVYLLRHVWPDPSIPSYTSSNMRLIKILIRIGQHSFSSLSKSGLATRRFFNLELTSPRLPSGEESKLPIFPIPQSLLGVVHSQSFNAKLDTLVGQVWKNAMSMKFVAVEHTVDSSILLDLGKEYAISRSFVRAVLKTPLVKAEASVFVQAWRTRPVPADRRATVGDDDDLHALAGIFSFDVRDKTVGLNSSCPSVVPRNTRLLSGKHYFEVVLHKLAVRACLSMGWASNNFKADDRKFVGVGHGPDSWALSLDSGRIMHNNAVMHPHTSPSLVHTFQDGDVVGVAVDMDSHHMCFYVNGVLLERTEFLAVGELIPVVSGKDGERFRLNFGRYSFAFPLEGYSAVHASMALPAENKEQASVLNAVHFGDACSGEEFGACLVRCRYVKVSVLLNEKTDREDWKLAVTSDKAVVAKRVRSLATSFSSKPASSSSKPSPAKTSHDMTLRLCLFGAPVEETSASTVEEMSASTLIKQANISSLIYEDHYVPTPTTLDTTSSTPSTLPKPSSTPQQALQQAQKALSLQRKLIESTSHRLDLALDDFQRGNLSKDTFDMSRSTQDNSFSNNMHALDPRREHMAAVLSNISLLKEQVGQQDVLVEKVVHFKGQVPEWIKPDLARFTSSFLFTYLLMMMNQQPSLASFSYLDVYPCAHTLVKMISEGFGRSRLMLAQIHVFLGRLLHLPYERARFVVDMASQFGEEKRMRTFLRFLLEDCLGARHHALDLFVEAESPYLLEWLQVCAPEKTMPSPRRPPSILFPVNFLNTCFLCTRAGLQDQARFLCANLKAKVICAACEQAKGLGILSPLLANSTWIKLRPELLVAPPMSRFWVHNTPLMANLRTVAVKTQDQLKVVFHAGIRCDGCQGPLYGVRYKCVSCEDFDLCEQCESKVETLHPHHMFLKLRQVLPSSDLGTHNFAKVSPLVFQQLYVASEAMTHVSVLKRMHHHPLQGLVLVSPSETVFCRKDGCLEVNLSRPWEKTPPESLHYDADTLLASFPASIIDLSHKVFSKVVESLDTCSAHLCLPALQVLTLFADIGQWEDGWTRHFRGFLEGIACVEDQYVHAATYAFVKDVVLVKCSFNQSIDVLEAVLSAIQAQKPACIQPSMFDLLGLFVVGAERVKELVLHQIRDFSTRTYRDGRQLVALLGLLDGLSVVVEVDKLVACALPCLEAVLLSPRSLCALVEQDLYSVLVHLCDRRVPVYSLLSSLGLAIRTGHPENEWLFGRLLDILRKELFTSSSSEKGVISSTSSEKSEFITSSSNKSEFTPSKDILEGESISDRKTKLEDHKHGFKQQQDQDTLELPSLTQRTHILSHVTEMLEKCISLTSPSKTSSMTIHLLILTSSYMQRDQVQSGVFSHLMDTSPLCMFRLLRCCAWGNPKEGDKTVIALEVFLKQIVGSAMQVAQEVGHLQKYLEWVTVLLKGKDNVSTIS